MSKTRPVPQLLTKLQASGDAIRWYNFTEHVFINPESGKMKKSEFERIVTGAFRSLEVRHGFKMGKAVYSQKNCTIKYQNTTTDVTLHYELGREPWLDVSDVTNAENKSTLGWLLVERGVVKSPAPEAAFRSTHLPDEKLAADLEKKVRQLIEHGTDLMNGDFSLMPRLHKRAKKYAQDCDRYIAIHKSK